jgi:hypothetical protein
MFFIARTTPAMLIRFCGSSRTIAMFASASGVAIGTVLLGIACVGQALRLLDPGLEVPNPFSDSTGDLWNSLGSEHEEQE